jgi:hypothetical protein
MCHFSRGRSDVGATPTIQPIQAATQEQAESAGSVGSKTNIQDGAFKRAGFTDVK